MTRQVLFVHGGGDGAYAEDAQLASDLRERLGSGYNVRYPMMPDEDDPGYEVWKGLILNEVLAMGDGAILVGHSIGGSVLIKLLTEEVPRRSLAGVFLISAPFWHEDDFWRWDEVRLPQDAAARLPANVPIFLYHGCTDASVPFTHFEMYARAIPQAIRRPLDNRDHQLNNDLSEVAADIRRLI